MEAVIEKECSALGGLFQTIISDMKVGRRGCGYADLAAGLPLPPSLPAPGSPGPPAAAPGVTCSPAAAAALPQPCWLLGQATSRPGGWGPGGGNDTEAPSHLCLRYPRRRHHPVPWGGGGGPQFQVSHCLSLGQATTTRGGRTPGRTPDSLPGSGVVVVALPRCGKECVPTPPTPGPGDGVAGRLVVTSLASRSPWSRGI
ncbi:hypothetical protein NN561_017322 [Cricetulus griseus]